MIEGISTYHLFWATPYNEIIGILTYHLVIGGSFMYNICSLMCR